MNNPHGNKRLQDAGNIPDNSPSSPKKKSDREEKLAKQLRANLAQRKTQARARKNDKDKEHRK